MAGCPCVLLQEMSVSVSTVRGKISKQIWPINSWGFAFVMHVFYPLFIVCDVRVRVDFKGFYCLRFLFYLFFLVMKMELKTD